MERHLMGALVLLTGTMLAMMAAMFGPAGEDPLVGMMIQGGVLMTAATAVSYGSD